MNNMLLTTLQGYGTALAFILYPLMAGFAFAVHPNLLKPQLSHDIQSKILGFHGNKLT